MGLTPEEVRNVTFPHAPWGRRGYHEDSVDAFLDYAYAELVRLRVDYRDLARLSEENFALREQLAALGAQPPTVDTGRHRYPDPSDRTSSAQHL